MDTLPIEVRASAKYRLGMPTAEFFKHYWQKQPLLIREAFADFQSPITPNDLAGLALEPLALSRIVSHDRRRDAWKLETGPFTESRFARAGKRDWTLLVQDVDKWDADVAGLFDSFDFLPRWRIDDIMVSYAVEGGSVGAHVDQYDVFLLQGLGQRRWQIDVDPEAPRAFREDVELKLLKEFWPTHDWVLGPGDMLYLPPNVPHHGVALDECLTISVGMRAPAIAEMVGDLADSFAEHLTEDDRFTDPDLKAAKDPFEIDQAAIGRVRTALKPLLDMDDTALGQWFARFITRYRSAQEPVGPQKPLTRAQLEQRLKRKDRLQVHPFARMARVRQPRGVRVFLAGQAIDMSQSCYAHLSGNGFGHGEFLTLNPPEQELLRALLNQGLLVFAKG